MWALFGIPRRPSSRKRYPIPKTEETKLTKQKRNAARHELESRHQTYVIATTRRETRNSMPTYDEYFKPQFVNLNNIPDDGIQGTIVSADFEEVGQSRDVKPVVRIECEETGDLWAFVVNQTNGAILGSIYGRGFDRWENKPIALSKGTAGYKGKDVPSVVVDRAATRAMKESATSTLQSLTTQAVQHTDVIQGRPAMKSPVKMESYDTGDGNIPF